VAELHAHHGGVAKSIAPGERARTLATSENPEPRSARQGVMSSCAMSHVALAVANCMTITHGHHLDAIRGSPIGVALSFVAFREVALLGADEDRVTMP